ncbi:MAG: alpha-N-acetylglucosaminidase, partial [Muribaculaceae bacterium]|nr:alpha-N-acetylglucosaminidase [Muribaculaceae bacterium]
KGSAVCDGNSTDAEGQPHRWVYGALNNFGGNVGLFGRVRRIASSLSKAIACAKDNNLVGIGLLPEGIENNPVLFDMVCDYAWSDGAVHSCADSWLEGYIASRYGLVRGSREHELAMDAWRVIFSGIYDCDDERQQGTTESVMMMRPGAEPASVSAWASSSWYWDRAELRRAAGTLASLAPRLSSNANFRYDIVDITRQCLADRAYELLAATPKAKDMSAHFLRLIGLQDSLLSTHPSFRLSTWLEMARKHGSDAAESDFYERSARLLITTWGGREASEDGELHDYANREWSGLLSAFYAQRWRRYFDASPDTIDWFGECEYPFVEGRSVPYGAFRDSLSADAVDTACRTLVMLDSL